MFEGGPIFVSTILNKLKSHECIKKKSDHWTFESSVAENAIKCYKLSRTKGNIVGYNRCLAVAHIQVCI